MSESDFLETSSQQSSPASGSRQRKKGRPRKSDLSISQSPSSPRKSTSMYMSPSKHATDSRAVVEQAIYSAGKQYPGSGTKRQSSSRRSLRTPVQTHPLTDKDSVSKSFYVLGEDWDTDTPRSHIQALFDHGNTQSAKMAPGRKRSMVPADNEGPARKSQRILSQPNPPVFKSPRLSDRLFKRKSLSEGMESGTPTMHVTPRTAIANILDLGGFGKTPMARPVTRASSVNKSSASNTSVKLKGRGQIVSLSPASKLKESSYVTEDSAIEYRRNERPRKRSFHMPDSDGVENKNGQRNSVYTKSKGAVLSPMKASHLNDNSDESSVTGYLRNRRGYRPFNLSNEASSFRDGESEEDMELTDMLTREQEPENLSKVGGKSSVSIDCVHTSNNSELEGHKSIQEPALQTSQKENLDVSDAAENSELEYSVNDGDSAQWVSQGRKSSSNKEAVENLSSVKGRDIDESEEGGENMNSTKAKSDRLSTTSKTRKSVSMRDNDKEIEEEVDNESPVDSEQNGSMAESPLGGQETTDEQTAEDGDEVNEEVNDEVNVSRDEASQNHRQKDRSVNRNASTTGTKGLSVSLSSNEENSAVNEDITTGTIPETQRDASVSQKSLLNISNGSHTEVRRSSVHGKLSVSKRSMTREVTAEIVAASQTDVYDMSNDSNIGETLPSLGPVTASGQRKSTPSMSVNDVEPPSSSKKGQSASRLQTPLDQLRQSERNGSSGRRSYEAPLRSSTPRKRNKSFFSSTQRQSTMFEHLAKDGFGDLSSLESIGSISPITPISRQAKKRVSEVVADLQPISQKVAEETGQEDLDAPTSPGDTDQPPSEGDPDQAPSEGDASEPPSERDASEPPSERDASEPPSEGDAIEAPPSPGDEEIDGYSPLKTPQIDMAKRSKAISTIHRPTRPQPLSDKQPTMGERLAGKKKGQATKKPPKVSKTTLPRRSVKFFAEKFSSMKLSKDAIEEIEKVSELFWEDSVKALEAYALHARRKTVQEEDVVLLMKSQRLIKGTGDLHDRIRELLPMELRMELIPCALPGGRVSGSLK